MSDILNAALDYAAQGLPVLPLWGLLPSRSADGRLLCRCGRLDCKRGKHPMAKLVRHGSLQATTHPPTIEHFWSVAPAANVGIATGPHAVGLDVDPREGGDAKLADLTAKHGPLPKAWHARTGSGGDHYFFQPPRNVEIRNFRAASGAHTSTASICGARVDCWSRRLACMRPEIPIAGSLRRAAFPSRQCRPG
jgi:Bifunctional DNA primase/polymerase, N-terminal